MTSQDASISWYDGTIESAFSTAKADSKPIFLYWGAVWCPPCMEIKSTVFKSQEFINLTRLFVPVYLDGDTERAQSWGEKFGVKGYPTMIVFNPDGEELTRLPGNIDIARYNTVLELSLNQMTPMSDIVQRALTDAAELSEAEYRQLAYYSWFQDVSALPEGAEKQVLFSSLAEHSPQGELSTRFFMLYLISRVDEGLSIDSVDSERLRLILSSDELTLAAWDTLAYYSPEILAMVSDSERESLGELWWRQTFELRFAESLSRKEKLAGWFPRLNLLRKDDLAVPDEVAEEIRRELAEVDRSTRDRFERQSVVNQMGHVFRRAGLLEDAKTLLRAELEKSDSPYYFMSTLGYIAEQEERFDEALNWRAQAYENAAGQATRFQWGTEYVGAMLRMSPDNNRLIEEQAVALLDEFDDRSQVLAGRNFARLTNLSKGLNAWPGDADQFQVSVETLCAQQPEGSPEAANCATLLASPEQSKG